APGVPAKMPFWKGDKPGRPLELGRAIGSTIRELRKAPDPVAVLQRDYSLDELAAQNLMAYIAEQAEEAGAVPDDRTIVLQRFREAAARALLLPRRRPDRRTPLWQQRQRSADLLEVASHYPTFPILLEATRECVRDVFDLPALKEVLRDIQSRKVRIVAVETK